MKYCNFGHISNVKKELEMNVFLAKFHYISNVKKMYIFAVQLSYSAKLQKDAIFHYSYWCEQQTIYTKGNKCKIMKYTIYAKSA